jgi:hypothetical protein
MKGLCLAKNAPELSAKLHHAQPRSLLVLNNAHVDLGLKSFLDDTDICSDLEGTSAFLDRASPFAFQAARRS